MSSRPAATVTFLCVAPEYVGRGDAAPEAAAALVARLATAARAHDGLVPTRPAPDDLPFAVFPRASAAVAAATSLAAELPVESASERSTAPVRHRPPAGATLHPGPYGRRLRMALHTGAASRDADDFRGPTLHRCICLRDIAYPGQVLLSLTTAELVRDALPEAAELRPLGAHRLRDLTRAEQVHQLCHPALPVGFPLPRSLDTLPHNLPVRLTSFVGRESEIADVKALMAENRLITLTGAGGCGKTSLAQQVAAALLDTCPDGAWLVDLAPLRDAHLVPQAVAGALGLREEPGRPHLATLTDYCRSRRLLLLLDNCEHLIESCAALAGALLQACPQVQILATSREALAVPGETVWQVPPLTLPTVNPLPPVARLTQYEAVRLFIDRAVAVLPRFAVTNQNAPAVAQICHRLDGTPLAIELAAARVKVMTVDEIAARLDDRFRLLTGGSRTVLPRHQTLRAAVDWSHDLLSDAEQQLFARLAVFAGGFTMATAERVCAGGHVAADAVSELVWQLVEKSLVVAGEQAGEQAEELAGQQAGAQVGEQVGGPSGGQAAETRYHLLETIRQYAEGKLAASGEAAAVRQRHFEWCLDLAEQAEPSLWVLRMAVQPEAEQWQARLVREQDNLRAALRCAVAVPDAVGGLRLAGALAWFWFWRGALGEGRQWLEAVLRPSPIPGAALAKALAGLGLILRNEASYAQAEAMLSSSLAIRRDLGDRRGTAETLFLLGSLSRLQGHWARADGCYSESQALHRDLGDRPWEIRLLAERWGLASRQGEAERAAPLLQECLDAARRIGNKRLLAETLQVIVQGARVTNQVHLAVPLCEEAVALTRELGDKKGLGWALMNMGFLCQLQGDWAGSVPYLTESLALRRELGFRVYIADTLYVLGRAARERQQPAVASSHLQEALTLQWDIGDKWGTVSTLQAIAGLAAAQGRARCAARLLGSAAAAWEILGSSPSLPHAHTSETERFAAVARAALGEEHFAAAWAAGQAQSLAEAVAEGLALCAPAADRPNQPADPQGETQSMTSAPAAAPPRAPESTTGPHRSPEPHRPHGLTAREAEVAALVADGLTDREIATRLFISPRTVDTHLRNIFGKVGVSHRAGLATWATRQGLDRRG